MYHQRKTEVRKLVTKLEKEYTNEGIGASTSSKELFKVSNNLLGKSGSYPAHDLQKQDLPDTFANYFENKIGKFGENMDLLGGNLDSDPFQYDTAFHGQPLNQFEPVTEKEVRETILKCPLKSSEIDPIPTSLLKELIDEVVPVLTKLFNISLSCGIVPTAFKQAIVKPVLKKTGLAANELKNVRPVSNLPLLSKIIEKVVLARLSKHLLGNNLLEKHFSLVTDLTTLQKQPYSRWSMTCFVQLMKVKSPCWLC